MRGSNLNKLVVASESSGVESWRGGRGDYTWTNCDSLGVRTVSAHERQIHVERIGAVSEV